MRPKLEILPPSQLKLWPLLSQIPKNFILYEGTAVALQLGHRESIDFDFFLVPQFRGLFPPEPQIQTLKNN